MIQPDLRGMLPVFGEVDGPSSYSTGGFTIDVRDALRTVLDARLVLKTRGGTLVPHAIHPTVDSPTAGQATFKVMRRRFDRVSSFGNVQNQPAGVTVSAASGQVVTSENTHDHTIDHDHGSQNSSVLTAAGAGVNTLAGIDGIANHVHAVDLPNFTGTSGAGTSHNHADNNLYSHTHAHTYTATDFALTEISAGTNLSTSRWWFCLWGAEAA